MFYHIVVAVISVIFYYCNVGMCNVYNCKLRELQSIRDMSGKFAVPEIGLSVC